MEYFQGATKIGEKLAAPFSPFVWQGVSPGPYTLTAKIKTTPGFERIPILALTANVMRGDKEKTLEAGCDGYIQKPIDFDELVREVERFVARSANV